MVMAMAMPEFYIVGAMKSATVSLHQQLGSLDEIFVPPRELYYFSMDDFNAHPDFYYSEGHWVTHDFENDFDVRLNWYMKFFQERHKDQICGDHSTTYLTSSAVPERIARHRPDAKIIIMLRDPSSRAYSHYWHMVRQGWAQYSFEDCLRISPMNMIDQSSYLQHARRYLEFFPRHQVHFVLFEKFVRNTREEMDKVCEFLGVKGRVLEGGLSKIHNVATIPRFIALQLLVNRCLWRKRMQTIHSHLALETVMPTDQSADFLGKKLAKAGYNLLNPFREVRPPPMSRETRAFLDQYFMRVNKGLDEVIGMETKGLWYKSVTSSYPSSGVAEGLAKRMA